MFDKNKFANIIKKINDLYENQISFAEEANINRTYLSQYMNLLLDAPPTPKKLTGIAKASKGLTTYNELMEICGYIVNNENDNTSSTHVDVYLEKDGKLFKKEDSGYFCFDFSGLNYFDNNKTYFAYQSQDDSMLPLLGIGDIAIIEETDTYENGNTCLISLDNELILIRKIIEFNDYIELHTAFPYSQPIKITNEEKESRKFKILGKVIKAENQSAFK